MNDLRAIRRELDLQYFEHARDWSACLIAFFSIPRINKYVAGGLRFSHVVT